MQIDMTVFRGRKRGMNYKVIRSRKRRKSLSLQITPDARIVVRAPYFATNDEIRRFVEANQGWIERNAARMEKRKEELARNPYGKITEDEIRKLSELAARTIPPRVAVYAAEIGVTYGRITIRNQKTRWGSCSAKGNLNFNCLLMLVPPDVQDYVIVHELCHRKQMNHSRLFWNEVEKILPDYRERDRWLKENGGQLIARTRM
jgi:predicted metal-dependent hydrolase